MAEDRRPSRSDAPGHDLSQERDQFLRTFSKGAQMTREFVEQYESLQKELANTEDRIAAARRVLQHVASICTMADAPIPLRAALLLGFGLGLAQDFRVFGE